MKIAIVYIAPTQAGIPVGYIGHVYDGPLNQSQFSGDNGRPEVTKHIEVPEGWDHRALVATVEDGEVDLSEDPALKSEMQLNDLMGRVADAMSFGNGLILKFTAQNVALGITQAGKTAEVLAATVGLRAALASGSLYEAIAMAKATPNEQKDQTFITDARLLAAVNEIEVYLELPLSESL